MKLNARDSSNGISQEYFTDENDSRNKRQSEYNEMNDELDPSGDIQNIWQGMVSAMVDGAKQIVKKVAESFDSDPEQQSNMWTENLVFVQ